MKIVNMDALIKGIQELIGENDVYLPISFINEFAENYIVDAAPKWIPCEERLPEPTQKVLVTGINGCVYTSRIVHGEFEYGGNVIAWMPLPGPYMEERKNNEID